MLCHLGVGTKFKVSHQTNFENVPFRRVKTAVQCILQGNLLNPGSFGQLLLLKQKQSKNGHMTKDLIFTGLSLWRPQKYIEDTSLFGRPDKDND